MSLRRVGQLPHLKDKIPNERDVDMLEEWNHGNLMRFNETKYEVLHLGQGMPQDISRQSLAHGHKKDGSSYLPLSCPPVGSATGQPGCDYSHVSLSRCAQHSLLCCPATRALFLDRAVLSPGTAL